MATSVTTESGIATHSKYEKENHHSLRGRVVGNYCSSLRLWFLRSCTGGLVRAMLNRQWRCLEWRPEARWGGCPRHAGERER
jgi:hypothetical protein